MDKETINLIARVLALIEHPESFDDEEKNQIVEDLKLIVNPAEESNAVVIDKSDMTPVEQLVDAFRNPVQINADRAEGVGYNVWFVDQDSKGISVLANVWKDGDEGTFTEEQLSDLVPKYEEMVASLSIMVEKGFDIVSIALMKTGVHNGISFKFTSASGRQYEHNCHSDDITAPPITQEFLNDLKQIPNRTYA